MNDNDIEKVAFLSFFQSKNFIFSREIESGVPLGNCLLITKMITANDAEHMKCRNQSRLFKIVEKAEILGLIAMSSTVLTSEMVSQSFVTSNHWNFQLQHGHREGKEGDVCLLCKPASAGVKWHG